MSFKLSAIARSRRLPHVSRTSTPTIRCWTCTQPPHPSSLLGHTPLPCHRCYSSPAPRNATFEVDEIELKTTLRALIPERRLELKELKSHADKKIGDVKVENVLGGMRGLKSMIWDGSVLDANEGIRFHGHTIADCSKFLPKGKTGQEMAPEGMFWLLLTGVMPTQHQVNDLSRWLANNSQLPKHIFMLMRNLPHHFHPMTKLAIGVSALNSHSAFARRYAEGKLDKKDYWEPTFDDALHLIAKLPSLAGLIYTQNRESEFEKIKVAFEYNQNPKPDHDWAYNFALMMGKGGTNEQHVGFQDLLRLYIALHADHEGGNVSAHATRLVGSALSDPFLSYSAGLQGLAGPLHGLAAQEVLSFIKKMRKSIPSIDPENIRKHLWSLLNSGQVIPGYGHAVLRRPDPRFEALMNFGLARESVASDPLFQLVKLNSEVAPEVLTEHGKTKNPYPNVDSASGVLFNHYGIHNELFYTVIFGVSRALGPLAQLVWDRALGLPIERPKSMDMTGLLKLAQKSEGS